MQAFARMAPTDLMRVSSIVSKLRETEARQRPRDVTSVSPRLILRDAEWRQYLATTGWKSAHFPHVESLVQTQRSPQSVLR